MDKAVEARMDKAVEARMDKAVEAVEARMDKAVEARNNKWLPYRCLFCVACRIINGSSTRTDVVRLCAFSYEMLPCKMHSILSCRDTTQKEKEAIYYSVYGTECICVGKPFIIPCLYGLVYGISHIDRGAKMRYGWYSFGV